LRNKSTSENYGREDFSSKKDWRGGGDSSWLGSTSYLSLLSFFLSFLFFLFFSLINSLVEGGLGCALWDGSIVLSRWIYTHRHLFSGCSVLELGAGCGQPGLVAAKYAKKVVMTEYVQQLVDNITYNIELNSTDDGKLFPMLAGLHAG